ncbi:hypothetical protein [Streptococcus pyogenes NS88.2]|nr:hypothetical protein [Streptococcus pyogenes NS88.2]
MTYFRLKKELNWSLRNKGIVVYEGNQKLQIAINTDKNNSEKSLFYFFEVVRAAATFSTGKNICFGLGLLRSQKEIGYHISRVVHAF